MEANSGTTRLIFITGTDTPAGGADLALTLAEFPGVVHCLVVSHDHVGLSTNDQIVRTHFHLVAAEILYFSK